MSLKSSVKRTVLPVAAFSAALVFVFFATSGLANPETDVLDETHPSIQAVMAAQEEVAMLR